MLISRLQSVLNAAACLIFAACTEIWPHHSTPGRAIHWLKVRDRIRFRLCVLAYRCLHGTAPAYLADSLQLATMVVGRRCLQSADTIDLHFVAKLLVTVPFQWRLLVPATLYCRLSDWHHHFLCFVDDLKVNFCHSYPAGHFYLLCILYLVFLFFCSFLYYL